MNLIIFHSLFGFALCSTILFTDVPKSIALPSTESASLRSTEVSELNSNLLGISSKTIDQFPVKTDLFSRPRAMAVVRVSGLPDLDLVGQRFPLVVDGYNDELFANELAAVFGADREFVKIENGVISGSTVVENVKSQIAECEFNTKDAVLSIDLSNICRLSEAIKSDDNNIDRSPDMFYITISASESDHSNVKMALQTLSLALKTAYSDRFVFEIILSKSDIHKIQKRAVSGPSVPNLTAEEKQFLTQALRKLYNITIFTSVDYPAMFAIFLGLGIILSLTVLYVAVGIWNMDPGRDSIIYRMSNQRLKRD